MTTMTKSDYATAYIAVDEAERHLQDSLKLLDHGELSPDELIEILDRAREHALSAANNLYDAIRAVGVGDASRGSCLGRQPDSVGRTSRKYMTTQANSEPAPEYGAAYSPTSQAPPADTRPMIRDASAVWRDSIDFRAEPVEHFYAWFLDVRHRVIAEELVGKGSLTGVDVHPRDVFRPAIVAGAAAIIFAHNHPSGDPTPSQQDVELTRRLRDVGEICGIPVLDHVVVCGDGWISLADRGWK